MPGSALAAPRSCSSVQVLAAGSPGFPLTCPATQQAGAAGLGEARPPPSAREPLRARGHPGSAPHSGPPSRAAPCSEQGRSVHSALCPLPAAVSLPPAVLLPASPGRCAGPPARLSGSAPRLGPESGRGAGPLRSGLRPGLAAPGPGFQDAHLRGSVLNQDCELGARRSPLRGDSTASEEKEGGRAGRGGGGGRMGRGGRRGGRDGRRIPSSSPQPGPARHRQLETSVGRAGSRGSGALAGVEVE